MHAQHGKVVGYVVRVLDAEVPRGVVDRGADHAQVAADVHDHAGGSGLHQVLGNDVGGESLPDSTEVDGRPGRHGDGFRVVVDLHPFAHAHPVARERWRLGVVDAAVGVAGVHQRGQGGDVEAAAGLPPCVECAAHHGQRVGMHHGGSAGCPVGAGDVAVVEEATPQALEFAQACFADVEHVGRTAVHHQERGTPHDAEVALERGGHGVPVRACWASSWWWGRGPWWWAAQGLR